MSRQEPHKFLGNTCKPMADSFLCIKKFTTNKKKKEKKIMLKKKRTTQISNCSYLVLLYVEMRSYFNQTTAGLPFQLSDFLLYFKTQHLVV